MYYNKKLQIIKDHLVKTGKSEYPIKQLSIKMKNNNEFEIISNVHYFSESFSNINSNNTIWYLYSSNGKRNINDIEIIEGLSLEDCENDGKSKV